MTCRHCGAEIAANALICYRCGTATTEPRMTPPGERRASGPNWLAIGASLAALAAAAFGIWELLGRF
jgi:predicted RNA-binding protein with PUA domain